MSKRRNRRNYQVENEELNVEVQDQVENDEEMIEDEPEEKEEGKMKKKFDKKKAVLIAAGIGTAALAVASGVLFGKRAGKKYAGESDDSDSYDGINERPYTDLDSYEGETEGSAD